MLASLLALVVIVFPGESQRDEDGTIFGIVVNGTQSGKPIAGAEVQLRAGENGELTTVDSTTTDDSGKFAFRALPLDPATVYLAGANRDGVHYPAQRLQLIPGKQTANVRIVSFDAVRDASPLAIVQHDIDIEAQATVMEITERLVVSNASRMTYVGKSESDETPVTFQLSVPRNFDKATFDSEFYGRRFRIVDHRLVTDIPWTPGDAQLKFTYRIPLEKSVGLFQRPLDLPSSKVRVRIAAQNGQRISCNLPITTANGSGRVVWAADGEQLPAGFTIELQIGSLPVPWLLYARWASLGMLAALIVITLLVSRRHRGRAATQHTSSLATGSLSRGRSKIRRRAA